VKGKQEKHQERERDGGRLVSVAIRAEDLVTSVSRGKGERRSARMKRNGREFPRVSPGDRETLR